MKEKSLIPIAIVGFIILTILSAWWGIDNYKKCREVYQKTLFNAFYNGILGDEYGGEEHSEYIEEHLIQAEKEANASATPYRRITIICGLFAYLGFSGTFAAPIMLKKSPKKE